MWADLLGGVDEAKKLDGWEWEEEDLAKEGWSIETWIEASVGQREMSYGPVESLGRGEESCLEVLLLGLFRLMDSDQGDSPSSNLSSFWTSLLQFPQA